MSKSVSPKIRFNRCTDAWEQRKLGELTDIRTGSSNAQDAVPDGEYPFFIRSDAVERSNKYLYDCEAILIPGEGRLGEIYHYIDGKFDLHQRVYKVSDFMDIDGKFCYYALQSSFKAHALKYTVKATVDSLRLPTLTGFEFCKPSSTEEQKQIACFLTNLDNLITLHQRKYVKLNNYKSALADKIFPSVGQQPLLRIMNKEPWEEVSISEIGDYFNTDSLGYADLVENGKYKCLLYGDLYTKYNERVLNVKSSTDKPVTKLVKGDILFPTSTTVDALSLIAPSSVCEDDIYAGGDLFGIRPKAGISGTFISYYINNKHSLKNSFSKNAQGLTIVHIHYDNIKDEKIMLPNYDEQIAIVSLFTAIDDLIELENSCIDKLKIIKQAFLDKMFVKVEV